MIRICTATSNKILLFFTFHLFSLNPLCTGTFHWKEFLQKMNKTQNKTPLIHQTFNSSCILDMASITLLQILSEGTWKNVFCNLNYSLGIYKMVHHSATRAKKKCEGLATRNEVLMKNDQNFLRFGKWPFCLENHVIESRVFTFVLDCLKVVETCHKVLL